jgi:hypothetical protein
MTSLSRAAAAWARAAAKAQEEDADNRNISLAVGRRSISQDSGSVGDGGAVDIVVTIDRGDAAGFAVAVVAGLSLRVPASGDLRGGEGMFFAEEIARPGDIAVPTTNPFLQVPPAARKRRRGDGDDYDDEDGGGGSNAAELVRASRNLVERVNERAVEGAWESFEDALGGIASIAGSLFAKQAAKSSGGRSSVAASGELTASTGTGLSQSWGSSLGDSTGSFDVDPDDIDDSLLLGGTGTVRAR